tara:strand:+ start:5076 stop:7820 length:2745 start_codon:yes stop_codon:yes gene_type:complete
MNRFSMLILRIIVIFGLILINREVHSSSSEEKCFSCNIKIENLDKPFPLTGNWAFTRIDNLENKNPKEKFGKNWVHIKTPGSWKNAYNDEKLYKVGWYKGKFHFSKDLIGKDVRLLIDTYMAETKVYLDGKAVYERSDKDSVNRYFSLQPIPIKFKITKEKHTIAIRINSILMQGIYQLPFHLRPYKKFDPELSLLLFFGGNFRSISGFAFLLFGIFLIFVFYKTKNEFYLFSGLSGCLIFPFFFFNLDFVTSFISPKNALIASYFGMPGMMYTQFKVAELFYKKLPKLSVFYSLTASIVAIIFLYLLIDFNIKIFHIVRTFSFLVAFLTSFLLLFMTVMGIKNKVSGAKIFFIGIMCLVISVFNDLFNALGLIQSYGLVSLGMIISTTSILIVAANNYTGTYVENKKHLKEVTDLKDNLEEKVKEKTYALELEMESTEIMMEQIFNQKKKRDLLLGSLSEGFLTINKEGIIEEGATRVSQDLLEVNLTESEVEKIEIWDVLFQEGEKRDIFKKWIEKVFESKFSFRDLKGLAPKKFEGTKKKHIELEFRPIYEKESKIKVDKIVIIASDKTKEVELKEQLNRDKENIEFINKCLQNPLEFVDLIFDTQTLIHDFYFSYKGEKELLFRGFHTLKARFGLFGLKKITNLIDNIETAISEEKVGNMKRSIKLLDEKLISFMKTNRIIVEAANKALVEEGSAIQVSEVLKRAKQFNVTSDYIDYIKKEYLYSDIKTKFERYVSLVNELAQRQDKSIEVKISGEEILVDTNKYSKFINSSIHIFRNMVDHGIEPEDERIAKTKPQKGKIKLLFKKDKRDFEIEIQDDGQGIDLDKIKKKALDDGLKSKDEISNFKKQEILNLIFLPGFSTKEDVTDISGRGVGMDAVKKEVIDLNGDIQVSSKIDEGTTFVIKLPLLK